MTPIMRINKTAEIRVKTVIREISVGEIMKRGNVLEVDSMGSRRNLSVVDTELASVFARRKEDDGYGL